jgi:hypothetical protein
MQAQGADMAYGLLLLRALGKVDFGDGFFDFPENCRGPSRYITKALITLRALDS